MSDLDTAEFRKLSLIAAGVDVSAIPPILDTATWRQLMLVALQGGKINSLADVGDVLLTDPETGQVLTYYNGTWINQNPTIGSVQTFSPSADVAQPSASFFPAFTFNVLAGKKYLLQMNSLFRQNGSSQGKFFLSAPSGGVNYLSGIYTNYITSGPFPDPLISIAVSNNEFNDQRFRFDCIIQQPISVIVSASISNCTLKRGSQIVVTQIN